MAATLLSNPAHSSATSTAPVYRAWDFLCSALREEMAGLFTLSLADGGAASAPALKSRSNSASVSNGKGPESNGNGSGRPTQVLMDDSLTPEQQLEVLVRDHLDAVYRVAFSVVRDNALAEDVAQDAILKAWSALHSFRGDSSLRSWLLRITHNTAISTIRKRREELREPDLLPEEVSHVSTESQALDRATMAAFESALNQLDELSRSIVVLREVEGLSYDEIADILEVPLPTVKTRLLRARRVLASSLSDWRG